MSSPPRGRAPPRSARQARLGPGAPPGRPARVRGRAPRSRARPRRSGARRQPRRRLGLRLLGAIHHRRGRLSDAIAVWEELAAREAPGPAAIRHLGLIYEVSAREADRRDEPLPREIEAALGGALPDLMQSCRLALVGDLRGGIRAADRVLERWRGREAHVLKVAAIQRAWLLERAHDVQAAIATLERLADEPQLASDVERLLCLSILYEREGTPERVRRAVRAVRYAHATTREPTLLRRLARLLRSLGHGAIADELERRYLEIFLRRHGALPPRELARAGARSYVPLALLRALHTPRPIALAQMLRHERRRRPEHRRRAAVLALTLGDTDRALSLLRALCASPDPLSTDMLFLADAEDAVGHAATARALRLGALSRERHADATALLAMLPEDQPLGDDVARALGSGERLERWVIALRARVAMHPSSPAAWRALAVLERARGRIEAAQDHEAHARTLAERGGAPHGPVALAAAALRRGGEIRGLVHELWIEEVRHVAGGGGLDADAVLGSVSRDLRATAVSVFYSVRAFVRARYPQRVRSVDASRFLLKVTKDDELSTGDSVGLPMAIAFLGAFLGLPVPTDIASSGAVVCDAQDVIVIRRIGDVEAKILGAYERRLRAILLPAQNREDVERAERVPEAIAAGLVRYVWSLEDVCAELFSELF